MTKTKWLTVKQASQYCFEMGLPRSTKSIRRWCQFENVEAQKRQVANTEKWFIDQNSLEIKIKEELEFLKQSDTSVRTQPDMAGQQAVMTGHNQTRPDASGYDRSQPDMSAHGHGQRPDASSGGKMRDLEDQVLILQTDLKWRDKVITDQKQSNEILLDEVKGQSRYIGHLETNLLKLGGKTDQAFLKAPVPKSGQSGEAEMKTELINPEIISKPEPHPDQSNLYSG